MYVLVCVQIGSIHLDPLLHPILYKLVILIIYNLPLEMCIRLELMFLSIVILGTYNPGKNIDVEEKSRVK